MCAWKKCLCSQSARGRFWFAYTLAGSAGPILRRSLLAPTPRRVFLATKLLVSLRKLGKAFVSSLSGIGWLCFITFRVENVITAATRPSRSAQLTRRSDARLGSSRLVEDLRNTSGSWIGSSRREQIGRAHV